ncbi:MAG: dTDP-4-dehydrorhamnose 3,5-epimerase [Deltaproteobacteria bacterium]|nr:dTDP-4-dehydrorhamnose 3,5-epimerase [Deltaproteobacteria bacterium]
MSNQLRAEKIPIPGVLIFSPAVFKDDRGFFMESYNRKNYSLLGLDCEFVQDNHSSSKAGTVRGLHFQLERPQGKLVRVIQGAILDVVVDIRKNSPTFGQWDSIEISQNNKKQIWIPPGLAHGFSVLSSEAEVLYKTTDYYYPAGERGIRFDDPQLNINWRTSQPLLSAKDLRLPLLQDIMAELPE